MKLVPLVSSRIPPQKLSVSHMSCPLHISSGRGKIEAHKKSSTVKPEKAAPVTGTTFKTTGLVPVDSRQRTQSVHNCVT